jgi:T4 bacteriophage base plate protein
MALPKIEVPTYELELPVSKKTLKYRPFLVKEQKVLLMAMESGDAKSIQQAVADILKACNMSTVDIYTLPIIDIEYYFLNLRAKSVSEIVESKYRCNNEVDNGEGGKKECGSTMESKINLTEIRPTTDKEVDPVIVLNDKLSIKMKYPDFSIMRDSMGMKDVSSLTFNMLAGCIEYIYDGEQFYYATETTTEELVEFIEMLNQEQFEKMEEFFNSMPKLRKKVEMTCKKCGFQHSFDVEGLESFFA